MTNQTSFYDFCGAWRQARSDRHVNRDRRSHLTKRDREFFEKPAIAAGYAAGWISAAGETRPQDAFERWTEETSGRKGAA